MPRKITIAPDWVTKGELLMEGLVEEIAALWHACQHVEGAPIPGGHLDIPSVNHVLNALRRPLTTIRTIELEAFKQSDQAAYEALQETAEYHVLRGLIGPRNNAVHHPEVVDMDVTRAVGSGPTYAIFPRWKPRSEVPNSVFSFRGDFKATYADSYERAVGGRTLFDPLLDAYKLLDNVAGLAKRDDDGNYVGFPLAPLDFAAPYDYSRLHPDWPSSEVPNANLREQLGSELPGGVERIIEGFMRTADGVVLLGQTRLDTAVTTRFLDLTEQVVRDISEGYPYRLADGRSIRADLKVAHASAAGPDADLLTDSGLIDHTDDGYGTPWAGWWNLCRDDVAYYATVRRPSCELS
jgi:hypothetical protein